MKKMKKQKDSKVIRRVIRDYNGVILATEFKCHKCQRWVDEENTVFANPNGGEIKSKADEKPFCDKCMPDET